eukprot:gene7505-7715_t
MQQQACQDISILWQQVVAVYGKAQGIGAATKTETKVQECEDNGIRFVLRVASALKSKPKGLSGSKDQRTSGGGKGTASPAITSWIAVVLPVKLSLLMVTAISRSPLPIALLTLSNEMVQEDLWVTHLSDTHTLLLNKFNVVPHHVLVVTRQFESQQDPLNARDFAATQQVLAAMPSGGVAFYNCGEHSGRSQPHKHVQAGLPTPVSYNVVMSSSPAGSFLLMAPRRQETCGKLAINSLGFAGTILVKSEEDLQFAVQQRPLSILAEVGQPWASEKPSLL